MNDLIQRAVKRATAAGGGPSLIERAASRIAQEKRVEGLGTRDPKSPSLADIDGITHQGGTILGSSRSADFPTSSGQDRAKARLRELAIDGLIIA